MARLFTDGLVLREEPETRERLIDLCMGCEAYIGCAEQLEADLEEGEAVPGVVAGVYLVEDDAGARVVRPARSQVPSRKDMAAIRRRRDQRTAETFSLDALLAAGRVLEYEQQVDQLAHDPEVLALAGSLVTQTRLAGLDREQVEAAVRLAAVLERKSA